MAKILDIIGSLANKYGLSTAISILALVLGGYGCWQAHDNSLKIQQQELNVTRLEAIQSTSAKEVSGRLGSIEKSIVELTTQIKLLVDGKLNVGGIK